MYFHTFLRCYILRCAVFFSFARYISTCVIFNCILCSLLSIHTYYQRNGRKYMPMAMKLEYTNVMSWERRLSFFFCKWLISDTDNLKGTHLYLLRHPIKMIEKEGYGNITTFLIQAF